MNDINKYETSMLIMLAFLVILFGFYPMPIIETFSVSVDSLINNYQFALNTK